MIDPEELADLKRRFDTLSWSLDNAADGIEELSDAVERLTAPNLVSKSPCDDGYHFVDATVNRCRYCDTLPPYIRVLVRATEEAA